MITIENIDIRPNKLRLATMLIKYYDILIKCDLVLFRKEKLWVRMPEVWITKEHKMRFVEWESKNKSDEFQESLLNKVFEMVGLDLEKAIELSQEFKKKKKK